jgi:hypothetical protein
MPTDASVISASVVSGAISEIAPTVVVFPTPNPPAMTILTGTGALSGAEAEAREAGRSAGDGLGGGAGLAELTLGSRDCTESTDHSQDGFGVMRVHRGVRRVDVEVAVGAEVANQDLGDAEMQRYPSGYLRY